MNESNKHWLQWDDSATRVHGLLAVGLLLVCLVIYGLALTGPLFFDDIPNLINNVLLRIDGRDFDDWRVAVISNDAGVLHRPVAMLTFALNYVAAGEFSPLVLKGTNLAIHLLIGGSIYFLCRALLRTPAVSAAGLADSPVVALTATALWLLHPLQVSTVLYVIQRMAQLSALFTLFGLLVFCRYRLRWAEAAASTGELLAAGLWLVIITVLAMLSKENGALLPFLIAVIEVTLFRGVWGGRSSTLLKRLGWFALMLPLVLVALIFLLSPDLITGRYAGREFSLEERVLTQGRLLWQYLGWILLPNITSMGFFHDDIPLSRGLLTPLTTILSLVAWVGVMTLAVWWRKKFPLLVFALLFYLVGHALESTVLPLEMVFEHRNYLPSVGVCLLAAAVLCQLARRFRGLRLRVVLVLVFAVLVAQLLIRTHVWKDEMLLARFNAVNHPDSPRANFYYGNTLFERFARAEELGLDAEEQKSLAIQARNHFARMHALAPLDFPAMVMLYQLDTLHFPALAEDNDWLTRLDVVARTKRLHASDRTALAALASFSSSDAGKADLERVRRMLDQLVERYPYREDLLVLQYNLLAAQPGVGQDQLQEHLERALQRSPNSRLLYGYLIQYHGRDNPGLAYEAIAAWMSLDTRRRELSVHRRYFQH